MHIHKAKAPCHGVTGDNVRGKDILRPSVAFFEPQKNISLIKTKMGDNLKNPFTLVQEPIKGLKDVLTIKTSKGDSAMVLYGTVGTLVLLAAAQYVIKHIIPSDGEGFGSSPEVLESNRSSTKRPDRMMKRFSDAFTCVSLAMILFALFDKSYSILIPCLFFFLVSSLFARFMGEALAYGCGDKPATCTGLQDWSFFLLVSFIMIYGLSVTGLRAFMTTFVAVALLGVVSSTVSAIGNEGVSTHKTGQDLVIADCVMQYVVLGILCYMYYQVHTGPAVTGPAFGVDASSVY